MIIDPKSRVFSFREGDEALYYLPMLIDILRVNNKNKPVRMTRKNGRLVVVCYAMTDEEWDRSVQDMHVWTDFIDIWKRTYKED